MNGDDGFEAPHQNGEARATAGTNRRRRIRRRILPALFVLVAIVWGFAIWYSVTRTNPEDLDDQTAETVERICADALEQLRRLPAFDAETGIDDDIALIEDENVIFAEMTERLSEVDVENGDPRTAYEQWTDDWRAFVVRRDAVIEDLQADGEATPDFRREGEDTEPLALRMQTYSDGQGLGACDPTALQIEYVDRPREYPTEV